MYTVHNSQYKMFRMDQRRILFFNCFILLIVVAASRICTEGDKAPSCANSTLGCVCRSSVCISRVNLCPDKESVTIIQPMFDHIPSYAFENYRSLRKLEISGGIVNRVSSKAFWGLADLTALSLRDNLIINIENDTFVGLDSLRQLDISGNVIDYLHDGTFSSNKNIRGLNLQRNLVNSITKRMFAGCHQLQTLQLTSNSISSIESGAFSDLQNLQALELDDNYIAIVTPTTFTGLTSLRYLNLNANFMQSIVPGSFDPMPKLLTVDFSQNQLPFVAGNTFGASRNLEQIFLNQNKIAQIDGETFRNLTSLETLELSGNALTSWSFLDFPTPSNLKELFLSYNQISEMLVPTYSPKPRFPELQYLDLCNNSLSTFPAFFLKDAPLLGHPDIADGTIPTKFDLRENPLTCDCDYTLLNDSLEERQIDCVENTTVPCGNGSVSMLPNSDGNGRVYCQVSGSPLPQVIWKDSNNKVVTGYYNISGKITWLPVDVLNVDNYMCMVYNYKDNGKAVRQETDPTESSSSVLLLPTLINTITMMMIMLLMTK